MCDLAGFHIPRTRNRDMFYAKLEDEREKGMDA